MESIGKQLIEQRQAAQVTQAELARRTGVPQSEIARIEAGMARPSEETMEKLTAALAQEPQRG